MAVRERVEFRAPFAVKCTSCGLSIAEGSQLDDVTKHWEDGHIQYWTACRQCGGLCSFRRKAGGRDYVLHFGLSADVGTDADANVGDSKLAAAMRTRARDRAITATAALAPGPPPDPELEALLEARQRHATREALARTAAERKPTKVRSRHRSVSERERDRSLRAALGDAKAHSVLRAARKLRSNGVRLRALLGRVDKTDTQSNR